MPKKSNAVKHLFLVLLVVIGAPAYPRLMTASAVARGRFDTFFEALKHASTLSLSAFMI